LISYTSGTTGDPKGVKLSHKNFIGSSFAGQTRLSQAVEPLHEDDCLISYLPLAHVFEQGLLGVVILYGCKIGFYGGDVLKLTEDMRILKPTLFPSVPRLYNKIHAKISDGVNKADGLKGWMVRSAVDAKLQNIRAGKGYHHLLWDKIVFAKMKELFGGRVRIMITGSAPIAGEVLDFLKICFSAPICEGYGMTETCASGTLTFAHDFESGHVGGPIQNVKIRLRDIPEMNYLGSADPPKGEIEFWGTNVMSGYYKNKEKTDEVLKDGWLSSGDVGLINPNGSIKIIDRAKNIFKLSQGEYIAPEKLENVYIQSSWIAQIWIIGDSIRDYIIAFIVVEPEAVQRYAKENGTEFNEALLKDDKLRQIIYDDIIRLAGANKFNSLEKPKQMTLIKDPWTVEDGHLTPTQKLKR